ncbi:MAG: phage tail tape measure protein, partial [Selenomonadaceae bacterium]|nr:phage tail tape measure protein [Selenomonadaceae bacterium]
MIRKGAIVISDKTITIVVDLKDATGGKVKDLQKQLNALDKQAARLANRFKTFSTQKWFATMRFIDRVTAPASRIQKMLQGITTKTWQISFKIADSALSGIRKIESALMRISGKAYNIAVNIKGGAMNKLNNLTSGLMMGAGMFAPVAGLAGVGFGVANAITASAGFEQQMSKVQAITQLKKDSDDMRMLVQQAKDLGMQTAWTRQQVGEAQYYQALAGWTPAQIKAATPHMLNLASAGGMDLGAASDMLTDAMTAFGLKATDKYKNAAGKMIELPEYMADMFAKVQAVSNTGLYELKEATKYSAATIGVMFGNVGGQEGVQLRTEAARQMLVMAGAMANAGIKGSMAGTGINTIFNRLAGENRNTFFASNRLLGIDPTDDKGNLIMPLDYIKAFQKKIRGGMSVDDFMQVAEELSGEKIHADTRRKLNSTIENALKNGGKLGSADMMKIGSMMAGLENAPKLMAMVFQDLEALEAKMNNVEGTAEGMANTMLDNLAGSFTKLGSAWDAFQQDFFTGTAGDGLRGLVDSLTEILTRANKLFQDGVNFSDFGKIIFDVIDRLKNKFLEFNSVGSLLAGGALMAALTKIVRMAQRGVGALKGLAQSAKAGTLGAAASTAGGLSAAQKVGTMTIHANVVNLNGAVRGGYGYGGGGRGGYGYGGGAAGAAASPMAAMLAAQKQFDKANTQFLAAQAKRDAKWGKVEQLFAAGKSDSQLARARATARKFDETRYLPALERQQAAQKALVAARVNAYNEQIAQSKLAIATAREVRKANLMATAGGAAVFAGIFGLLDVMSLKSANAERLAAATSDSER